METQSQLYEYAYRWTNEAESGILGTGCRAWVTIYQFSSCWTLFISLLPTTLWFKVYSIILSLRTNTLLVHSVCFKKKSPSQARIIQFQTGMKLANLGKYFLIIGALLKYNAAIYEGFAAVAQSLKITPQSPIRSPAK